MWQPAGCDCSVRSVLRFVCFLPPSCQHRTCRLYRFPVCRQSSLVVRHWQPTLRPRPVNLQCPKTTLCLPSSLFFCVFRRFLPPRPPDKLYGSLTRLGEAVRRRRNRFRGSPFLSASIGDAGIDRRRLRPVAPISFFPSLLRSRRSITIHVCHRTPRTAANTQREHSPCSTQESQS